MKRGGCAGLLTLYDITRESVFGGWKITSQFSAQSSIFIRSEVMSSAGVLELVTQRDEYLNQYHQRRLYR